jgi:hypothetical protein
MFPWSWHSPHQSLGNPGIQPEINKRKRKELRFYLGRKIGVRCQFIYRFAILMFWTARQRKTSWRITKLGRRTVRKIPLKISRDLPILIILLSNEVWLMRFFLVWEIYDNQNNFLEKDYTFQDVSDPLDIDVFTQTLLQNIAFSKKLTLKNMVLVTCQPMP